MFDNTVSMFRVVSIGTASENKKLGSDTVRFTPHEKFTFMDGEIVHRVTPLDYTRVDQTGSEVGGNSFNSVDMSATWLPETNRRTAPDVQRGEMLFIWQMAGSDKYYWRPVGKDDHLRRLETVVVGIAANPEMDQDGRLSDNMYFLEVSSHNKTITLATSQKNGEYCKYVFQLDLARGRVVLEDSVGMCAIFDSKDINIRWQNQLGSYFEMNKRDFNVYMPNDVNMKVDHNFSIRAGNDINLQAGNNGNVSAANTLSLNGGGSVMTLASGGTTLKTPNFKGVS